MSSSHDGRQASRTVSIVQSRVAEQVDEVDAVDDTSSSGISSDEESEEEQQTKTINKSTKTALNTSSDLKARLSAFLPQLKRANKDLEDNGDASARQLDDVANDAQQYIEMNLSLGVLSENSGNNNIETRYSDSDENSGDDLAPVSENLKEPKSMTKPRTRKVEEVAELMPKT